MIRLFFLFLLIVSPLFATNTALIKQESSAEKNLVLSSDSLTQKSQKSQPYLQSELSITLILFGLALMIAEIFVPGFGILGIGGVIAFASGSLLLFDADTVGRSFSIPVIIAFSLSSLAFFILVMRLFLSSKSTKVLSRADELIGADAEVVDIRGKGYLVYCHGETWSATSESKLSIGQSVEVVELLGLILRVKPTKE
ncbi:MAG: NfeD family protein [Sulfurimonas sp.]|nr:NfeD family protein [Sulfurimonas sp.]MDD3835822.1 NfeD family protein [Sulfurimonas sp.]